MKIVVNKILCSGHARCGSIAPEVYELNDEGYIGFEEKRVPPGLEAAARRGARACPERAITLVEDAE
jgi:ferredoxin